MSNGECLLLCEGENDKHVFWNLFELAKIPKNFTVKEEGDIDKVLKAIPLQLKREHLQILGVVVDADQNVKTRWNKIRSLLRTHFPNLPDEPVPSGWIGESETIRAGVWVMPDNKLRGSLEDFVTLLIDENDKLQEKANEILNDIEKSGLRLYKSQHQSKAFINTWLAWQKQPGLPMGRAIKAKYLNYQKPEAKPFLEWVRKLFEQS